VDSFNPHVPGLEHLIEKRFYGFFSEKKIFGGTPGNFRVVSELKLRSTSSALQKFSYLISWITSKDEGNLEICPFLKTLVKKSLEIGVPI